MEQLDALHRLAAQVCRRPEDAADLVQETFGRALRACDGFEDRGAGAGPWLFRILMNTFYSRQKREGRAPAAAGELFGADERERAPDEPPPAWDLKSLDWEHVDERLKSAIDGLRPEHRVVLLLWGVEGMKYREIAEVVQTPIGTVMSRLHRARQTLAAALEGLPEELGIRTGPAEGVVDEQ